MFHRHSQYLIAGCIALMVISAYGCNKDKEETKTAAEETGKLTRKELSTDGLEKKKLDINKDGIYDQYIYYDGDVIKYAQRDFNFDGILDMTEFYENGKHVRDEIDLDYDGICDVIVTYENEIPVKKEYSIDFEGNRHGTQYFNEKGERIRIERDTNNDRKPDRIEYYESGSEEPVRVEEIK